MERKKFKCPPKHWSAFPGISQSVRPVVCPDKTTEFSALFESAKVFVGYLNEQHKIYFDKRNMCEKYIKHLINTGKCSQVFKKFTPTKINWNKILGRYKRDCNESHRQNTDVRTSYKCGNKFLVCCFFTFGQTTVAPGTVHVYQTTKAPVLFYLVIQKGKLTVMEKYFPYEEIRCYDRRILLPNTAYAIPEGTTYFILTTQKTYFALDIVDSSTDLPFACENPVKNPVWKLAEEDDYAFVKTPYVDCEERDEYEEILNDGPVDWPAQSHMPVDWPAESSRPVDWPAQSHMPVDWPAQSSRPAESSDAASRMDWPAESSDKVTFYIYPPLPIMEKNITVASPDFIAGYQKLQCKRYDDPKICVVPQNVIDEPPLDLRMQNDAVDDEMMQDDSFICMDENVECVLTEDKMDDALNDLFSSYLDD